MIKIYFLYSEFLRRRTKHRVNLLCFITTTMNISRNFQLLQPFVLALKRKPLISSDPSYKHQVVL